MNVNFPLLALALALGACAAQEHPAPLGPQPLQVVGVPITLVDLQSQIVGNTGVGTRTGTRVQWTVYVGTDGRLATKTPINNDTGTWRMSPGDGRFCMTLRSEANGQENCYSPYRRGNAIELVDGDTAQILVFSPGNRL